MVKQSTKPKLIVLFLTILYVIAFGIYYIIAKNYEFIIYVIILLVLILIIIKLNSKFNLPTWVLAGTSLWGFSHMAGGSFYINGIKLYGTMLIDFGIESFTKTPILRYDHFAHFFCYVMMTFIIYYIIKTILKPEKLNSKTTYLIIFLASIGIGSINEILEFIPVLILKETGVGDYFNTLWDLVFNTLGTITALIFLKFKEKR